MMGSLLSKRASPHWHKKSDFNVQIESSARLLQWNKRWRHATWRHDKISGLCHQGGHLLLYWRTWPTTRCLRLQCRSGGKRTLKNQLIWNSNPATATIGITDINSHPHNVIEVYMHVCGFKFKTTRHSDPTKDIETFTHTHKIAKFVCKLWI